MLIRNTLFIVVVLNIFLLANCSKSECSVVERHENKQPKLKICIKNDIEQYYYYEEFHPNGKLSHSYFLRYGKLEGLNNEYYDSGNLSFSCTYRKGQREGTCFSYLENGQIDAKYYYASDKLIYGEFYEYDSTEVRVINLFDPIIELNKIIDNEAKFLDVSINLPIPDSLIDQRSSIFKYDLKPLYLKDSVILTPRYEVEIFYNRLTNIRVPIESDTSQLFYGYILEDGMNVHNHFEKEISFNTIEN